MMNSIGYIDIELRECIVMNRFLTLRTGILIACLLCLTIGYVLAADDDAAYIYGKPPTSGKITLKLVNNEDDLDVLAVITKGGDKTPLLAIYIPSDSVGSIKKMEKGRYDIYFTAGIDWNEDNFAFNDGRYYKLKSPQILGDKTEYQVDLYADEGKMGTRIKHISDSIFPDITGAQPSDSGTDSEQPASSTSEEKPVSTTKKKPTPTPTPKE